MHSSIIAEFDQQQLAAAAADRLASCGVALDHLFLEMDERGMYPAASSHAPTTVVRERLDTPAYPGTARRASGVRMTDAVRDPALQGRTRLFVALPCDLDEDELRGLLLASGAGQVRASAEDAPRPNPAMSPTVDVVDPEDAERARAAARGGLGLDDRLNRH